MKIHYFQRYHKGEDVATANTMLLLSRLYSHSTNEFFEFLKNQYFADVEFEPEIVFKLQDKGDKSVPDATITQPSFKLVVETKMTDWFYKEQLMNHLAKFNHEEYKVLITLSSELMNKDKKAEVDKNIAAYNMEHETNIIHINTTFELLANGVADVLSDHDYEMQDILDDYLNYCYKDALIVVSDSWKKMRVQLAGTTYDFNMKNGLYYDGIDRPFSPHDYLGLYKQKSVRAVGKIIAIITASLNEKGEYVYRSELGELTPERKKLIAEAISDGKKYGYSFDATRYFFVDKFYETDFKKVSKGAPMGSRVFDLTSVLGVEKLPDVKTIADKLQLKEWR